MEDPSHEDLIREELPQGMQLGRDEQLTYLNAQLALYCESHQLVGWAGGMQLWIEEQDDRLYLRAVNPPLLIELPHASVPALLGKVLKFAEAWRRRRTDALRSAQLRHWTTYLSPATLSDLRAGTRRISQLAGAELTVHADSFGGLILNLIELEPTPRRDGDGER